MGRNIYLETMTLEAAHRLFNEKIDKKFFYNTEEVSVVNCYGRVTAEPVYAKYSNPNFNASAMDGIAVISKATHGADERNHITLKRGTDYIFVDTGDAIVEPYDSVVMIENVQIIDEDTVKVSSSTHPWENIRMIGEDFVVGDMIITRNHKITAVDMGALVSGGVEHIKVYSNLRVSIIPTGTEIVEIGTNLKQGDILESNSHMFAGLVIENGGTPIRYPIVPDNKSKLREAVLDAIDKSDLVIINAGSSAGSEDFTSAIIKELGEVWVHGIDIKPGKPAILGVIKDKPVIGIPGYPVSAYMTFKHFVVPILNRVKGPSKFVEAILSQAVPSSLKHKEFVRVQLGYVGGKVIATPLKRGAASTMSLVKANGILTIEKESEGYQAGKTVDIEETREHLNITSGLVSTGSHDLIMDWISDMLLEMGKDTYLLSSHAGSMGGIMAIKRGEAHIAPVHLLDEETGEYNIKEIRRYLSDQEIVIVKGLKRWQGFYMRNEDDMVLDFQDIVDRNLLFINRQKGSGTRLLTDYWIKKGDVSKNSIRGYQTEVLTHTAVALAVKEKNADIGIGIESVARSMNLNYRAIAKEDYDFIIPKQNMELKSVKDFLEVLQSDAFKRMISEAGGYEMEALSYLQLGGS